MLVIIAAVGTVLFARNPGKILNRDILHGHAARIFIAQGQIALTIALRDLDSIVDIVDCHGIVENVADLATASTSLEICRQRRWVSRPHFDPRHVTGIAHSDVVHGDVLHNVSLTRVLTQRPHTDAVAAITVQVLHHNLRTVRFERHAIVAVIDDRVLDDNIARSIRVPAVRVLCDIAAGRVATDGDVVEDHIARVRNEVVPLRRVSQIQI